jgi:hypothetical protein
MEFIGLVEFHSVTRLQAHPLSLSLSLLVDSIMLLQHTNCGVHTWLQYQLWVPLVHAQKVETDCKEWGGG